MIMYREACEVLRDQAERYGATEMRDAVMTYGFATVGLDITFRWDFESLSFFIIIPVLAAA